MSNFNFGQLVSIAAVQENHIDHVPGNPVTPPGMVIDQIAFPGDPSLHFGQAVSEFIHNPVSDFHLLF